MNIPAPPRPWSPTMIARILDADAQRRTLRPGLIRRTAARMLRAFARMVRL